MSGFPVWYELMSPDPAGVAPFYRAVIGWDIAAEGMAMPNGSEYRMIALADGGFQGGVLTLTEGMLAGGAAPGWVTYFDVGDVDAKLDEATAMGAVVHIPAVTMEGVGRMAMLADPQGAPFYLMDPTPPADNPDAQSGVFMPDTLGHCAWNELNTDAAAEQIDFYTALFDWEVAGEMPMPGDHIYKFLNHRETGVGAIGSMKPEGMPNAWLPYFRVADIGAAASAVEANGGTVLMGPQDVPGGDRIIVTIDPAGAAVGLVGKAA